jgi:S1-C subfamily serine protease
MRKTSSAVVVSVIIVGIVLLLLGTLELKSSEQPGPVEPSRRDNNISWDALNRVQAWTVFITSRYISIQDVGRDDLSKDDYVESNGSGSVLTPNGLILTNEHVVASVYTGQDNIVKPWEDPVLVLDSVTVRLNSGNKGTRVYPAQVLCTRPFPLDIALLRIETEKPLPAIPDMDPDLRLEHGNVLSMSQKVWAVGYPMGMGMETGLQSAKMSRNPNGPDVSVRDGSISALRKDANNTFKVIEHTCRIEPGNSGGALVDSGGSFIGINSFGLGKQGAFAIPREKILDEFGAVLHGNGYKPYFGYGTSLQPSAKGRTIRVDPKADAPRQPHKHDNGKVCRTAGAEGAFATVSDALDEAHPGDTILLVRGEHVVTVDKRPYFTFTLRVRGEGIGHTIIRPEGEMPFVFYVGGKQACIEISDMTIESDEFGAIGLAIDKSPNGTTLIHDMEIKTYSAACVRKQPGAALDIVNCRIGSGSSPVGVAVSGNDGSRIERITLNEGGCIQLENTDASVEGCYINPGGGPTFHSIKVIGDSNAVIRGCKAPIMAFEGKVLCEANLPITYSPGDDLVTVQDGASIEMRGNRIEKTGGHGGSGILIKGKGTSATLTNNLLLGSHVAFITEGASAKVTNNRFFYDRADRMSAISPNIPYGLTISGQSTRVTYSNNDFSSKFGGAAIAFQDGARDLDSGGNKFLGNGIKKDQR